MAKQVGDTQEKWNWVEPSVWTERMLTALEKGVRGGKWFSLIDKVGSRANLMAAYKKAKANKGSAGVDHVTIEMFEARLEENLERLSRELISGSYEPQAIRRVWIPKTGSKKQRPLGIPTIRDRVVQGALRNAMEPIFEKEFAAESYGFRPGRGAKDALRRVDGRLKEGYTYVVEADLESYYDTIPQEPLMDRVEEHVADGKVLELIKRYLNQEVMESAKRWTPEKGTPQGAVISPLLSNIYLNPLDHLMAGKGYKMVRYADDFVILCESEKEAQDAIEEVSRWVGEAELRLHPEKTRIVYCKDDRRRGSYSHEKFDFLGFTFRPRPSLSKGGRQFVGFNPAVSNKAMKAMRKMIRSWNLKRRTTETIENLAEMYNPVIRGWINYYGSYCKTVLYQVFKYLDVVLSRWAKRKYKRIRGRQRRAIHWVKRIIFRQPGLFAHWRFIYAWARR